MDVYALSSPGLQWRELYGATINAIKTPIFQLMKTTTLRAMGHCAMRLAITELQVG